MMFKFILFVLAIILVSVVNSEVTGGENCQQKVAEFAASVCDGPCQRGFLEFIEYACSSQVSENEIRHACCGGSQDYF